MSNKRPLLGLLSYVIWRLCTPRWNLRVPDLEMICRDFITGQGYQVNSHNNGCRVTYLIIIIQIYDPDQLWLWLAPRRLPSKVLWPSPESNVSHWPLGDLDVILKIRFSILFFWLVYWYDWHICIIMPSDECYKTLLTAIFPIYISMIQEMPLRNKFM